MHPHPGKHPGASAPVGDDLCEQHRKRWGDGQRGDRDRARRKTRGSLRTRWGARGRGQRDFELDRQIERTDLDGELTFRVGISGRVRYFRACFITRIASSLIRRFGTRAEALKTEIMAIADGARLKDLIEHAATCRSLAAFPRSFRLEALIGSARIVSEISARSRSRWSIHSLRSSGLSLSGNHVAGSA